MPNTDPIFSDLSSSRQQKFKPAWLLTGAIFTLALVAGMILLSARPQKEDTVVRGATVAAVEKKTIRDIVSVSGVLELSRKEILTAPGAGVVERVSAEEGSILATGDEILRIETDALQSDLDDSKLSLEKLLRQGEQDAASRTFSIRQNQIGISSAQRNLTDALASLKKTETLRAANLASEADVLNGRNLVSTAEEALEQAKLKRDEADALYSLSLKNSDVDRRLLESTISDLSAKIKAYTVRTARGGTVYSLSAENGGSVNAYSQLAVVADPSDVRAALDVPETRIASVAKGMEVTVYVGDSAYPAVVDSVAPSATSSSSSAGSVVRVVASFKKKPERPTIGGTVSGEIVAGTIKDALVLPRGAFLSSGNYAAAYIVANGKAEKQSVKYGIADGSYIQVSAGLAEGDKVIVSDYRDFMHLDSFPFVESK